jgi:hypothetical protein
MQTQATQPAGDNALLQSWGLHFSASDAYQPDDRRALLVHELRRLLTASPAGWELLAGLQPLQDRVVLHLDYAQLAECCQSSGDLASNPPPAVLHPALHGASLVAHGQHSQPARLLRTPWQAAEARRLPVSLPQSAALELQPAEALLCLATAAHLALFHSPEAPSPQHSQPQLQQRQAAAQALLRRGGLTQDARVVVRLSNYAASQLHIRQLKSSSIGELALLLRELARGCL